MKAMKTVFAVALVVLATGCGKSEALKAAEEYETTACACKTLDCTTAASKAYTEKLGAAGTAKSGEAEALTKSTANAAACVTKLALSGIPGLPSK
jgi:hypothetical protein